MSSFDPKQLPELEFKDETHETIEDETSQSNFPEGPHEKFCALIGSIIVDGTFQGLFTLWHKWMFFTAFGLSLNGYLWWAGLTLIFVSLNWYHKKTSANLFVSELFLSFILTVILWIIL